MLAALLATGALALFAMGTPRPAASHWPTRSDVFAVPGWSVGDPAVDMRNDVVFVNRRYIAADARVGAVLGLVASPDAKRVFRAGPEVPFAGAGYGLRVVPSELLVPRAEWTALIATRGKETLLVLATHGERRGLLGNGVVGWAAVGADGLLGVPNDYFEVTLVAPLSSDSDVATARAVADLADRAFGQISAWYAR